MSNAARTLLRFDRKGPTRVRRADHAARPLEKLDAELGLDLADRLGKRRLRDAEALGRPSEVQLLEDREEIPQVSKLDRGRRRAAPSGC